MTQVIACALAARRDAGAEGRRRQPRRGARGDRARRRRRAAHRRRRRARSLVSDGRATGVRLAGGETVAGRARGRRERDADAALRAAARRGRRAGAPCATPRGASATAAARCRSTSRSSEPPRWRGDERLGRTRDRPRHPRPRRRLARGQRGRARPPARRGDDRRAASRCAVDPSRAPDGSWILWIQLQELPSRPKGDAAGELDVGDGTWTEELREAYADRIVARLGRHIANLGSATLAPRRALPRRHRGGERQPRRRRHLRRLAARSTRTSSGARCAQAPGHGTPVERPLAHRREHAPRPRPRRRLGLPRREEAAPAAAAAPVARQAPGAGR